MGKPEGHFQCHPSCLMPYSCPFGSQRLHALPNSFSHHPECSQPQTSSPLLSPAPLANMTSWHYQVSILSTILAIIPFHREGK